MNEQQHIAEIRLVVTGLQSAAKGLASLMERAGVLLSVSGKFLERLDELTKNESDNHAH